MKFDSYDTLKNLSIAIALAILIPMLSYYTAQLFSKYSGPYPRETEQMRDLDGRISGLKRARREVLTSVDQTEEEKKKLAFYDSEIETLLQQYNNESAFYQKVIDHWTAREKYNQRVMFVVAGIIGLISILFGLLSGLGFIGGGAILGGVASLTLGYFHYWGLLSNIFRVGSILLAVLSIIGMSYWFAKKE